MEPHGNFNINVFNETVYLKFEGGFNSEGVIKFNRSFKEATSCLNGSKWESIVEFGENTFGIPESEIYWRNYFKDGVTRGMVKASHINANVVVRDQIVRLSSGLPLTLVFND